MKTNSNKNWMRSIDNSTLLNTISLPGTNNSGTQFCTVYRTARCQYTSIEEQLNNGFRFLDIRLVCKGQRMFLVHGAANCQMSQKKLPYDFADMLRCCYQFLHDNPSETILMSIKKDRGYHLDKLAQVLLDEYFSQMPERWYLSNKTPTLEAVRGKIVLLRRYVVREYESFTDENSGLNFSVWPDQKSRKKHTGISFDMETTDRTITERPIRVQDRYSFPADEKWNQCALPELTRTYKPQEWNINFLSTMYGSCPQQSSERINQSFLSFPLAKGNRGIIVFDYGSNELASKVIDTNFAK